MVVERRGRSAPKCRVAPQAVVDSERVHETLPQGSARSTDNATVTLGTTASPPVSRLVDIYDQTVGPACQAEPWHATSCAVQEIGMSRYQPGRGTKTVENSGTGS